ncbi:hypothetical protein Lpp46_1419 [Lacticaseibacillus paracasei subsp. paracasei Lpp46]|nr:hypothetical protein Lpp46_1419 [Lacticaseibacillus paracasei subsp. paracasei Lpp46]
MTQLIGIASTYQEVRVVINQIMSDFMKKLPKSLAELFSSVV